jgi:hypothetical protein
MFNLTAELPVGACLGSFPEKLIEEKESCDGEGEVGGWIW